MTCLYVAGAFIIFLITGYRVLLLRDTNSVWLPVNAVVFGACALYIVGLPVVRAANFFRRRTSKPRGQRARKRGQNEDWRQAARALRAKLKEQQRGE